MSRKAKAAERRVGGIGEAQFKLWCENNGLPASKSDPDCMGWDYLVELDTEIDHSITLDRQGDLKKVLVQIKSTDSRTVSKSVNGKLSAFKRLVDADMPAFIAHIEYSGLSSPQRARLLHVGPTQIGAILRTVRQIEQKGRIDLNNVKRTLPLDEASEITSDGGNLRSLILEAVPRSSADYAAAKATFRKTCGYDEHSITADFSLAPGMNEEALVDLLIGKAPHLPITEMVISTTRFGIALDKDIDRFAQGTLSVEVKPFQRGKLVAISPSRSRRFEMPVDVFAPGIPGLPNHLRKIRLTNEFIDLALHFAEGKAGIKFHVDPEARYPIDALANVLGFGVVLAEDGARLEADLGSGVVSGAPPPEAKQLHSWRTLHEFTDMLSVALFRHRRNATVEVTMPEMKEALEANTDMFALLARPGLEMTLAPSKGFPASLPASTVIFVPTCIEFRSLAYFAMVRAEAKEISIKEDGSIWFVGDQPRVIEDGIIERTDLQIAALNKRAAELGRKESSEDRAVITITLADPHQPT